MNIMLFENTPKFISLKDPRGRHIKKVLRLQAGDCLKAGLLNGPRGSLCITAVEAEGYRVEWSKTGPAVGLYPLTLIVGFVRPISVKRILREAASLGIGRLVFTVTDTGESSYREANLWKTGEYREYLINGLQTAGATVLPEVLLTGGLGEALEALDPLESHEPPGAAGTFELLEKQEEGKAGAAGLGDSVQGAAVGPAGDAGAAGGEPEVGTPGPAAARGEVPARLVLDNVGAGRPLSRMDLGGTAGPAGLAVINGSGNTRNVVLAVGSERGWSERERRLFLQTGFEPATLGSRVLRTETACSTGAALALARMGYL